MHIVKRVFQVIWFLLPMLLMAAVAMYMFYVVITLYVGSWGGLR
jgi:hypothetical protein